MLRPWDQITSRGPFQPGFPVTAAASTGCPQSPLLVAAAQAAQAVVVLGETAGLCLSSLPNPFTHAFCKQGIALSAPEKSVGAGGMAEQGSPWPCR